jgi:hypothetical protein
MKIGTVLRLVFGFALAVSIPAKSNPQKGKIPASTPPEIRVELEKLLSSELPQRLEGAYNLGNMGAKAVLAIPFLIGVLHDNEGMVDVDEASLKFFEKDTTFMVFGGKAATINPMQIIVSVALAKIGKTAREPLRAELSKADPAMLPFAYFADSLVRMQDPDTTKMLIAMLSDSNRQKRYRIAEALRYSKDPASIDALITALKDQDSNVKSAAGNSLKRITGQDFGEDASKWEEWRGKNKPKQAHASKPSIESATNRESELKCQIISTSRVDKVEGGFASWTAKDPKVATGVILLVKLTYPPQMKELLTGELALQYKFENQLQTAPSLGVNPRPPSANRGAAEDNLFWILHATSTYKVTLEGEGFDGLIGEEQMRFLFQAPIQVTEASVLYQGRACGVAVKISKP